MDKKNRCCYCGSTDVKHIIFFFAQCEECGEAQALMDLIDIDTIPLNMRKRGKR